MWELLTKQKIKKFIILMGIILYMEMETMLVFIILIDHILMQDSRV